MACIGLRDVIPSIDMFPVKKLSIKLDISGDSKEPIITNKHAVSGGSSNFFEILTIPLDVPLDIMYSPVLTVYVYDHVMGFLGTRLLGIANIPLEPYCIKIANKLKGGMNAFGAGAALGGGASLLGGLKPAGKGAGLMARAAAAPPKGLGGFSKIKKIMSDLSEHDHSAEKSGLVSPRDVVVDGAEGGAEKTSPATKFAALKGRMGAVKKEDSLGAKDNSIGPDEPGSENIFEDASILTGGPQPAAPATEGGSGSFFDKNAAVKEKVDTILRKGTMGGGTSGASLAGAGRAAEAKKIAAEEKKAMEAGKTAALEEEDELREKKRLARMAEFKQKQREKEAAEAEKQAEIER